MGDTTEHYNPLRLHARPPGHRQSEFAQERADRLHDLIQRRIRVGVGATRGLDPRLVGFLDRGTPALKFCHCLVPRLAGLHLPHLPCEGDQAFQGLDAGIPFDGLGQQHLRINPYESLCLSHVPLPSTQDFISLMTRIESPVSSFTSPSNCLGTLSYTVSNSFLTIRGVRFTASFAPSRSRIAMTLSSSCHVSLRRPFWRNVTAHGAFNCFTSLRIIQSRMQARQLSALLWAAAIRCAHASMSLLMAACNRSTLPSALRIARVRCIAVCSWRAKPTGMSGRRSGFGSGLEISSSIATTCSGSMRPLLPLLLRLLLPSRQFPLGGLEHECQVRRSQLRDGDDQLQQLLTGHAGHGGSSPFFASFDASFSLDTARRLLVISRSRSSCFTF